MQSRICPAEWSSTRPSTGTSAAESLWNPATRLANRLPCSPHRPRKCCIGSAPGLSTTPLLSALFLGALLARGLLRGLLGLIDDRRRFRARIAFLYTARCVQVELDDGPPEEEVVDERVHEADDDEQQHRKDSTGQLCGTAQVEHVVDGAGREPEPGFDAQGVDECQRGAGE